ncbi:RNA 2'-phosphotransferase [Verrucomicrobiaceae bacterium 227]
MSQKNNKLSRTLSLVLRHDPGAINLTLDPEGWASVDELLACMTRYGKRIDLLTLQEIVAGSDKQRFRFSDDGQRIRANQGHSIQIDLQLEAQSPPDVLYHGTALRFMDAIEKEGLKKMARQHVHLSPDIRTAHAVGMRHGRPVILEIAARSLANHGFQFYLSENGVWLTEEVPPDYLVRRFSI